EQMNQFMSASELHTVQPPYNLFERQIDRDVLPYVREKNLSVLAYGPLCRGLLTGTMQPDTKFTGDDLRQSDPKFQPPRFAQYLNAVQQLDDLEFQIGLAEIVAGELRVRLHCPRQEPPAERPV